MVQIWLAKKNGSNLKDVSLNFVSPSLEPKHSNCNTSHLFLIKERNIKVSISPQKILLFVFAQLFLQVQPPPLSIMDLSNVVRLFIALIYLHVNVLGKLSVKSEQIY